MRCRGKKLEPYLMDKQVTDLCLEILVKTINAHTKMLMLIDAQQVHFANDHRDGNTYLVRA